MLYYLLIITRIILLTWMTLERLIINEKDMQVYCTKETKKALKREFSYVFSDIKYPGVPRVIINNIKTNHLKLIVLKLLLLKHCIIKWTFLDLE